MLPQPDYLPDLHQEKTEERTGRRAASRDGAPALRPVPRNGRSDAAGAPKTQSDKKRCPSCHRGLLTSTLLLTVISVFLIYSASTGQALTRYGNSNFFLIRQLIFAVIGVGLMIGASRLSRQKVMWGGWVLYGVVLLGLIATQWTPLGHTEENVKRWIKIGPLSFQISELAKIALLLVLAHYWSFQSEHDLKKVKPWVISGAFLVLPLVLLVMAQPHLSAALLILSLLFVIGFFAGVPFTTYLKILGVFAVFGCIVFGLSTIGKMPLLKPYQQERITHFLSFEKDAQGANYQSKQGIRAIKRGGLWGVGPGRSVFKQGHLPAPHTDFILAITGEEWGLAGMLFLLGLYSLIVFFCLQVAYNAGSLFDMLFASGMAALLVIQVVANMGVVLEFLPVTGILLPFISYGGSGLLSLLIGMGLVLGISRRYRQ